MTFQCGKILEGSFSVVDTSKPLLSIGKMTEHGHTVVMTPKGGYIALNDGKTKIAIPSQWSLEDSCLGVESKRGFSGAGFSVMPCKWGTAG